MCVVTDKCRLGFCEAYGVVVAWAHDNFDVGGNKFEVFSKLFELEINVFNGKIFFLFCVDPNPVNNVPPNQKIAYLFCHFFLFF